MTELSIRRESWPLRATFTISRGSKSTAAVVVAELQDGDYRGRGECTPYARYGETVEDVVATLEGLQEAVRGGLDREALQSALPPGAARNALDCAFWDLEAKRQGKRVWELLDLPTPRPVTTVYTLSLGPVEEMRAAAAANAGRPILKLKLAGPEDLARVKAVREGAPDARLVVDANEGWQAGFYSEIAADLVDLGVEMIEQPLHAKADGALVGIERPVALCADESCHDRASLARLEGLYDVINIKLDKTGGLTEALSLKAAAEEAGFKIMVGCMIATSLSMAPALLVAQDIAVVDLDGPLLLAEDRPEGLAFDGKPGLSALGRALGLILGLNGRAPPRAADAVDGEDCQGGPNQREGDEVGAAEGLAVEEDRQQEVQTGGDVLEEADGGVVQAAGTRGEPDERQGGHRAGEDQQDVDPEAFGEKNCSGRWRRDRPGRRWPAAAADRFR